MQINFCPQKVLRKVYMQVGDVSEGVVPEHGGNKEYLGGINATIAGPDNTRTKTHTNTQAAKVKR